MRTRFDIGEIIRCHGMEFFEKHKVVPAVRKAFTHMAQCRTSALGGHVEVCPECGEKHISYNSCRDRHCPKCQQKEREQWIVFRKQEIIPVKYFHVVFTVPACLHPYAMHHQRIFYDCMFRTAWATLKDFASSEGLVPGMTSILHTWGSNLYYHPHIHCIVPGGGVDSTGKWHLFRGCRRKDFLFPVRALGRVFRAKMLAMLTQRLKEIDVVLPQDVRRKCFHRDWVVYSRPPAKGAEQVLDYIGRYAYRVAISNSRILDVTGGEIAYDYKDYRNGGCRGVMKMSIDSFLSLLSMHILPDRFVRIRHYGFLSPSCRNMLRGIQRQLNVEPVPEHRVKKSYLDICAEKGWNIGVCKVCKCQRIIIQFLPPQRAPPLGNAIVREDR